MTDYLGMFERNYGVYSKSEQEKIRKARVLIVGVGGIGGTVAVILARSGVQNFTLVDFDSYDLSNINRQIACSKITLGQPKTEAVKNQIMDINPNAKVITYAELLSHDEIEKLMDDADLVFPAADDYAFSIMIFRDAQRKGKPALFVVPSGTWANVSIILPKSPSVEDLQGIPRLSTYEELKKMLDTRKYKFGNFFFIRHASWRKGYFKRFMDDDAPPAQICPTVWLSSSIGALEVLKVLSGKHKPVASPRYWEIFENNISIRRMNRPGVGAILRLQRKVGYKIFEFFITWPDKHIFYKVCLPCNFHYKPNLQSGVFISSCITIHNVQCFTGKLLCS